MFLSMVRPLRVEFAGAVHHVMSRGNARGAIVADDADRWRWLRLLERATLRHGWRVFALALMDNHYHVFLQTPEPNLSVGLQQLNSGYATYFNARHRRVGHVLQGRFRSIVVEEHGYWLELSRYVHLNPVRAGLVSRPEDWAWSSYAGYHRPARRLKWVDYGRVLAEFGGDTPAGRTAYRDYVAEGLRSTRRCRRLSMVPCWAPTASWRGSAACSATATRTTNCPTSPACGRRPRWSR